MTERREMYFLILDVIQCRSIYGNIKCLINKWKKKNSAHWAFRMGNSSRVGHIARNQCNDKWINDLHFFAHFFFTQNRYCVVIPLLWVNSNWKVIVLFNKFVCEIGKQNLAIVLIDTWRLKNEKRKKSRFFFLQVTNRKRWYKENYCHQLKFMPTRMTSNEYNIRDAHFCIHIQFNRLSVSCARSSRSFFNFYFRMKFL